MLLGLAVVAWSAGGCPRSSAPDERGSKNQVVAPGASTAGVAGLVGVSGQGTSRDELQVVLRGGDARGVPLHPAPRERSISGRLPDGTAVAVVETADDGHWLHVRAADGTSGWVIDKYAVRTVASSASAVAGGGSSGSTDATVPGSTVSGSSDASTTVAIDTGLPADFPLPAGACPRAAPDASTRFTEATAGSEVHVVGAQGVRRAADRLVVVSYNLWELYDGAGGDRYLAEASHPESATLDEAHAGKRIEALAAPLRRTGADVFVFQEVENAALACAVAHAADASSSWTCWAGDWAPEPHPQNVAIAARVPGTVVQLDPGPGMGQRGVLELSIAERSLRVVALHLKSSVGAVGDEDCGNAGKRMAVAYGLLERQQAAPQVAYLVLGDFNVDPADPAKDEYDRTDDILKRAGDEDLVARFVHPASRASGVAAGRSIIDRAFLRSGEGVSAESLRFVDDAPLGGWASDHRPLVVTLQFSP